MPLSLLEFLKKNGLPVMVGLIVINTVTVVLNYRGITVTFPATDDAFWLKAMAAAVSIAVGTALTLVWAHALSIVPGVLRQRHRVWSIVLTLFFLVCVFAVSGIWNVAALSVFETARLLLEELSLTSASALDAARQSVLAVNPLLTGAQSLANDLIALSDSEAAGLASGLGRGCQAICLSEQNAARSVAALIETVTPIRDALLARLDEAGTALRELQGLAAAPGAVEPQFVQAAGLVTEINQVLAEVRSAGLVDVMQSGLSPLADSFIAADLASEAARAQVASVREMIGARVEPLLVHAAELRDIPAPEAVVASFPGALNRAFTYFWDVIGQFGLGLVLDSTPILIMAYLVIANAAVRSGPPEAPGPNLHGMTVGQLQEALRVYELLEPPKPAAPKQAPVAETTDKGTAPDVPAAVAAPATSDTPPAEISPPVTETPPAKKRRGRPPKSNGRAVSTGEAAFPNLESKP